MANLPQSATWHQGIYQIETDDPVVGGTPNIGTLAGLSNVPGKMLADRTVWLKDRIDRLEGLSADDFYRPGLANTVFRMGSDAADNFDGIKFDDTTNTFLFMADADPDNNDPGDANVVVKTLRVRSTEDASETSTEHALELGDYQGGNGVIMDTNEVYYDVLGEQRRMLWKNMLDTGNIVSDSYSVTDASDSWLLAENIKGDTNASLGDLNIRLKRVGSLVHLDGDFTISGFSVAAASDDSITFRLDLGAIATSRGWFSGFIAEAFSFGLMRMSGAGWDAPNTLMEVSLNSDTQANANTLLCSVVDTRDQPVHPSDCTQIVCRFNICSIVQD